MKWVKITEELPIYKGKYVVETVTNYNNTLKFETTFNGKKFDVNNQVVVRWLKEEL